MMKYQNQRRKTSSFNLDRSQRDHQFPKERKKKKEREEGTKNKYIFLFFPGKINPRQRFRSAN